jgi:predicted phosphodiesterase
MKVLFLHLSDMHFTSKNSYAIENVKAITTSLQRHCIGAAGIVIVVSGDLTFSGYFHQCEQVKEFLNSLLKDIKSRYHFEDIPILLVPGNHDNNCKIHDFSPEELLAIRQRNLYQSNIAREFNKEANVMALCREFGSFAESNKFLSIQKIKFGDTVLKFNLINTAPFSALCEDQGFHYLPISELAKLHSSEGAEFTFTIMHHPYQFFYNGILNQLEEALIASTDIIFVGHEHYSKIRALSNNVATVTINAGGMLCNKGNWDQSEFYVGTLDTDTRSYALYAYKWNNAIYLSEEVTKTILKKSRTNCLGMPVADSYFKDLLADKKYEISANLLDYYVFPLLEERPAQLTKDRHEVDNKDTFFEKLLINKKTVIIGLNGSGKTVTSKFIFSHFADDKIVLFINGGRVREKKYERIVKNVFEDTYSASTTLYERFMNASKDEKVIIVDDIHTIPESLIGDFFRYLDENFGIIVLTMHSEIELDFYERLKQRSLMEGYMHYRIRSLYADKRKELVNKIVRLLEVQEDAQERLTLQICEDLAKHKMDYVWHADFVVQFTKYCCNNIGVSMINVGDTFSKVFEHSLTSLLEPFSNKIKVDKVFFILGKIAYEMHTSPSLNKKYPMLLEDVCAVIRKYNDDYNSNVDPDEFIEIVTKANIFKKRRQGYIFAQRNYLAYFVAKEIMQHIIDEGDASEFIKTLDHACFGINGDIILFVTYITDNPRIIRWIMDKAEEYANKWEEFSFEPVNVTYLSDAKQLEPMVPFKLIGTKESEQRKIEQEKETEKRRELVDPADIYLYDETVLRMLDELVRSVALTMILARALPSFEHILRAEDKERCVELLYSLPLQIFNTWANDVENKKPTLVSEIRDMLTLKNLLAGEYWHSNSEIRDADILKILVSESEMLLLELMNNVMYSATRSDTERYIDEFNYRRKLTYRLEHLMSVEKRRNQENFVNEAIGLQEDTKGQLASKLLQDVVKHFLLNTKAIDYKHMQKLDAKVFDGQLNKQGILLSKMKNEQRLL